jgi:hypothetical protein
LSRGGLAEPDDDVEHLAFPGAEPGMGIVEHTLTITPWCVEFHNVQIYTLCPR